MGMDTLKLAFGLTFSDLYERSGIERIDRLFLEHLHRRAPQVHERLAAARARPEAVSKSEYSRLLVDTAPHLDAFLGQLFGIEAEVERLNAQHEAAQRLYRVKRQFVQRRALHARSLEEAGSEDGTALALALEQRMGEAFSEAAFARHVERWLAEGDETALALAERYSVWAVHTAAGRSRHAAGTLFKVPAKLDPARLVDVELETIQGIERLRLGEAHLRRREGFHLTDSGMGEAAVLDQANYCIWCHGQSKDSCSTGLRDKGGGFRLNALGAALTGCPLEEKISEMNFAKAHGASLGALAIVTVDNPLAAATGHRICNDCMKACIYQKQEPVDIPANRNAGAQGRAGPALGIRDLLACSPAGCPFTCTRPVPRPETGYKVLVVGQGPAGFNLAHHLLNEGHTVVAVDGLKIEPLPESLSGVDLDGRRVPFRPIRDVGALCETLSERVMAGFGGVAEYGITVRWDKNFLKLVRLLLERRKGFALFGGVRFGGTFTPEDALALGFDHIALATGAGRPTVVPMENALARGVRMASDFLMALQLTGAARSDSIANLQIRLPAVVIGGGLTAIDAATETLAYYPVQVEKFLARYETLAAEQGEAAVRAGWSVEDTAIAEEFIAHARAIRAERAAAAREGARPRLRELLDAWGGVTIVYRRRLVDAPSYRLNHEEVRKAMEEGVRFAENLQPVAVVTDAFGAARALRLKRAGDGGEVALAARTVLIAAGTQPNTVLARELPGHLPPLDGAYYQAFDENGRARRAGAQPQARPAPRAHGPLPGRAGHELLGGPASLLRRQRGQGHGRREAGLPGGHAQASGAAARTGGAGGPARPVEPGASADGARGPSPDAHHRRGGGTRAHGRPPLPPGTVLSPAELRGVRAPRRWDVPRHGGARPHRGLGRRGKGPPLADRAGDGGIVRRVLPAQARRAGGGDGAHRRPDRDPRGRDGAAGGRRAWATRCFSPSARRCAPTVAACSTSPGTSASPTATTWSGSKRRPTWWCGAATRRPASFRGGPRTGPSSATSSRQWRPTPGASWGSLDRPFPKWTASSPSARIA
ncbi:MAG: hypothetical protein KatS3mg123_0749 [Burkholderiales bacterium]|nr:MAG: hypothetical protein KatS3mg123_0749 [Burkholderiales bacterium]